MTMTGAGDAAELGRGAAGVQLPGRLPQGRGARQHQHQGGADLHAEYVTPTPATILTFTVPSCLHFDIDNGQNEASRYFQI